MRDINAIGFSEKVEHIIGFSANELGIDDDPEPYTEETFFSKFLPKIYLDDRGIAVENIREGLTLEGYLQIPTILKTFPSKALDKIAFVDGGYDSAEDVIAFFEPVYCREVELPDEFGAPRRQAVESQVLESQERFFEHTLPDLLREIDAVERTDQEIYAKKVGKHEDFLSVCQAPVFLFICSLLFILCNAQHFKLHYLEVFLDYNKFIIQSPHELLSTIHPHAALRALCHSIAISSSPWIDGRQG